MDLFCRLCAKVKQSSELQTTINDPLVEQKLVDCCRWNALYQNEEFPRSICGSCNDKLQQSWSFAQNVEKAQNELMAYIVKQEPFSTEHEAFDSNGNHSEEVRGYELQVFMPNGVSENIKSDDDLPEIKATSLSAGNENVVTKGMKKATNNTVAQKGKKVSHRKPATVTDRSAAASSGSTSQKKDHQIKCKKEYDSFLSRFSPDDFNADGTIKQERITGLGLLNWSSFGYKCWKCGKILKSFDELGSHANDEHPSEPETFVCTMCKSSPIFSSKRRLQLITDHVGRNHIPHLMYCCFKCQTFYWNTDVLKRHVMRRHKSEVPRFKCDQCDKMFLHLNAMYYHRKSHSEEQPTFECYLCKKPYSHKLSLHQHMPLHLNDPDRLFVCDQCGTAFRVKRTLDLHLMTHSNERPHSCSECEKAYKRAHELKRHIEITHRLERRYQCTVCGRKFAANSNLRTHMVTHSDETPFACDRCDKKFRTRQTLRAHKRFHSGERPYACSECSYRATCYGNMHRHMKAKHGMGALGHIRIEKSKA